MGFATLFANRILEGILGGYIGLSTTKPGPDGDNFTEPPIDHSANGDNGGYRRGVTGGWYKTIDKQRGNKELALLYESRSDTVYTFPYFGIFQSATAQPATPVFWAELDTPITVRKGYVPIIRAGQLILGLDKDELEEYF